MHPCDHYPQHFQEACPDILSLNSPPCRDNHYSDFQHRRVMFPGREFHKYCILEDMLFCVWFHSLMYAKFIHIVAHYFLLLCSIPSHDCMLFIHSPIDAYLSCFHFSHVYMSKHAINVLVYSFGGHIVYPGYMPKSISHFICFWLLHGKKNSWKMFWSLFSFWNNWRVEKAIINEHQLSKMLYPLYTHSHFLLTPILKSMCYCFCFANKNVLFC